MQSIIKKFFNYLGYSIGKMQAEKALENNDIKYSRFEPYETTFLGHTFYVHDHDSFLLGIQELFTQGKNIYRFHSSKANPYIIDCGANLGMSIIFFKSIYPNSRIRAFEADPHIFSFLEKNVKSFGLKDVELINKAVWKNSEEPLTFWVEGGAGGRIEKEKNNSAAKFIQVTTTRLKDYLNEKIDFLKIDIEGAEFDVITDCSDLLYNVDNLFVEYHGFEKTEQNLHNLLSIFQKAGFRYHIKETFTSPEPFINQRINDGMDLQLNIFCYRKNRNEYF
ncbi:MAG TPA: FkbM family methyltransferase [Hanamia sp.]|nr:FkbM family methyltransferase [Hanamia sp.]